MTEDDPGGGGEPDPHVERLEQAQATVAEAWKQTLSDREDIAADRREDGWEVLELTATHTDTVSIDTLDHDKYGLFHVIPDNRAEEFEATYDDGFTEYLGYGSIVQGFMYMVTELIDPEERRSILIASQYDMTRSQGMINSADRTGSLYTYVRTIDGTILGSFEHEEYDPLLGRTGE